MKSIIAGVIKNLFTIAVIAGVVLLIFIWNPFKIFGDGLKLKPTANMVTEIRQIGQLVTAQYYGEVIASMPEATVKPIHFDSIDNSAKDIYVEIKKGLYNVLQHQLKPRAQRKEEERKNKKIRHADNIFDDNVREGTIQDKFYYFGTIKNPGKSFKDVIEFIWEKEKDRRIKKDAKDRHEEQVLLLLYREIESKTPGNNLTGFLNSDFAYDEKYSRFYVKEILEELPKEEKKVELSMIGRGCVKAGFDFGTLDEKSFYFDEGRGELHFFGLAPKILNADINPWFVPQKQIPGFEIINHNRKVDFKHAKKLKQYCIEKLTWYAQRADILSHAQKQGEETLKRFLSLLTGKEIKNVYFHNDAVVVATDAVAEDEYISYPESIVIDSIISSEQAAIAKLLTTRRPKDADLAEQKKRMLNAIIGKLRKLPFEDADGTFNYFSSLAYRIARDSILDNSEREFIEKSRTLYKAEKFQGEKGDTMWWNDSLMFMNYYNELLEYIGPRTYPMESMKEILLKEQQFKLFDSTKQVISWEIIKGSPKKMRVRYLAYKSQYSARYNSLYYPFVYRPEKFGEGIGRRSALFFEAGPNGIKDSAAGRLWIFNPKKGKWKGFDIDAADFFPSFIAGTAGRGERTAVPVNDSICFIFRREVYQFARTDTAQLTISQQKELAAFYAYCLDRDKQKINLGPFERSRAWLRKRGYF